jgi:hypothetical protein
MVEDGGVLWRTYTELIIKEKAMEIATGLWIAGFTTSNGWLQRFKIKN